jgi:hypothetical protein
MVNPRLVTGSGEPLPTPDGWFDDVAMAVQVHSWRWHSGRAEWESTVMADGVFAEHGVVVVAVTPRALRGAPERVLSRLRRAHQAAAARPRPDVLAVPQASRWSA